MHEKSLPGLTSDVVHRYDDRSQYFSRMSEGSVAKLLVRTDAWPRNKTVSNTHSARPDNTHDSHTRPGALTHDSGAAQEEVDGVRGQNSDACQQKSAGNKTCKYSFQDTLGVTEL